MTFYVENETEIELPFLSDIWIKDVIHCALKEEKFPYDMQMNILLTDNDGIQDVNKRFRGLDKPTDVLSFPNIEYETAADFSVIEKQRAAVCDPENDEIILGDIMISLEKVREQAAEYGHSEERELAFLLVHSILHLCGYDHETEEEHAVMNEKQEAVLRRLNLPR